MRRGEIWRYQPVVARPGQPDLRLIISADFLNTNTDLPVALTVHVLEQDPDNLLGPPVGRFGWAWALSVEPVPRSRLRERVGAINADAMEQVAGALRAVQDL